MSSNYENAALIQARLNVGNTPPPSQQTVVDSNGFDVNSPGRVYDRQVTAQDPNMNEYTRQLKGDIRNFDNSFTIIPSMNHNDMSNVPGPFIDPRRAWLGTK
jgi:phospholipase C